MSAAPGRAWPLTVLVLALVLLVGSVMWAGSAIGPGSGAWGPAGSGPGGGMMGGGMPGGGMPGGPMMGGSIMGSPGNGPVRSLTEARSVAQGVADAWDLRVREVMQFDNGYYVELESQDGRPATELLIDPNTGAVQVEWGPAMMWNTAYGMAGPDTTAPEMSVERAMTVGNEWLAKNRPGETVADPTAFPGYYTMHTTKGGVVTGMLSVNALTGDVWYHSWHGKFIGGDDVVHAS